MAKLTYFDHASLRIDARDGTTIYVDPFAPGDYTVPADIILVTHDHFDHNQTDMPAKKEGCRIITFADANKDGKYETYEIGNVKIEAVESYNKNHKKEACAGYIITVDGVSVYHAGDTSMTEQMSTFAARKLDYALLPMDGYYNMGFKEAAECAAVIGAKHTIPIHTAPRSPEMKGITFSQGIADRFDAPTKLVVQPGETIEL